MSKMNFNRNIFLEREEILRFQKFMLESPINKVFLSNTINYGIIDTSGGLESNDFKLENGSLFNSVKIVNLSRAYTSEGLLIEQSPIEFTVPSQSNIRWIKIGHTYNKLEEGTISITTEGIVTGNGTKFTEVLRNQSTEVPVKIKLVSQSNVSSYDAVDVEDDLNITLQGESFIAESGIKYFVIGSIPLGETVTSQHEEGLYFYDSCLITQVPETVEGVAPAGLVEGKEFWIARVVNNSGTVTIEDKREGYFWEYYIRGVSDKLDKNNNLSDLVNPKLARANLGNVLTTDEVKALLNVDDTGWLRMTPGNNIRLGYELFHIRRVGNIVTITAKFQASGVISAQNEVIASIAYNTIGFKAAPTMEIDFEMNILNVTEDETYGIKAYITNSVPQDTLFIRTSANTRMPDEAKNKWLHFTITYIGQ